MLITRLGAVASQQPLPMIDAEHAAAVGGLSMAANVDPTLSATYAASVDGLTFGASLDDHEIAMFAANVEGLIFAASAAPIVAVNHAANVGGLVFGASVEHIPSYEPETTTLLAAFTGTYDAARQNAINDLIVALKAQGIWAKLDVLRIAGLNEADSLVNWKNPGTWNSTAINSPAFVPDRGFTSSAAGSRYINTNFAPSTAGGNFARNSAHLGAYSRTDVSRLGYELGVSQFSLGTAASLLTRFTDGNYYSRINAATEQPHAVPNSQGFFITTRTNSTLTTAYRNGSSIGSNTNDSIAINSLPIFEGTQNESGSPQKYSEREISVITIGGGLTATEVSNYNTALVAYLTYIGANV